MRNEYYITYGTSPRGQTAVKRGPQYSDRPIIYGDLHKRRISYENEIDHLVEYHEDDRYDAFADNGGNNENVDDNDYGGGEYSLRMVETAGKDMCEPGAAKDGVTNAKAGRYGFRLARALFFSVIILFTAALILSATPYFAIKNIEIEGNQYYSKSQLLSKSGLRVGQNGFSTLKGDNLLKLLSFRCVAAERAVAAACPYIKTVQVNYIMPRTVRVALEERSKSVVIPYFGSGLLIDGEGVVVDIIDDYKQSGLPVVLGLPVTRYEMGKLVDGVDKPRFDAVLSIINALRQVDRDNSEALAWRIATIDVSSLKKIVIGMLNGIVVNLGDGADLYYQVSAVKEILTYGVRDGETGVIMFSKGARPVFIPN